MSRKGPGRTDPSGAPEISTPTSRSEDRKETGAPISKPQRLRLLHLWQRLYPGEDLGWDIAIHLDQRDRIGARRLAADMKCRDIDAGLAEHRGEATNETGLVEIG